jgi:hypothetical protein
LSRSRCIARRANSASRFGFMLVGSWPTRFGQSSLRSGLGWAGGRGVACRSAAVSALKPSRVPSRRPDSNRGPLHYESAVLQVFQAFSGALGRSQVRSDHLTFAEVGTFLGTQNARAPRTRGPGQREVGV